MAIFNAWCDRVPMLILGATGPWDAARRRPWIDWIHTASDQARSCATTPSGITSPPVPAAYEALLRAVQIADGARGPTYVNLDAALESKIAVLPLAGRFPISGAAPVAPSAENIEKAAQLLSSAKSPAILVGRVSRSEADWKARVALAEKLQARVFTDIKTPAAFPTDHPLHAEPRRSRAKLLKEADVILRSTRSISPER